MTIIELLVVMAVMTVAVTMFTSMVVHTARQRGINRENAIASNAARTQVELMRNEPFRDIFALYNEEPDDDPGGAGTAPGNRFEVFGLTPLPNTPDDMVGQVFFPVIVEVEESDPPKWGDVGESFGEISGGMGLGGGPSGGSAQFLGGGGGGGAGGKEEYYLLREDYVDKRMGMPRDLNGDSLIDSYDHSGDYILLPVHISIEWRGDFGPRRFDLYTQIAQFTREED